MKVFDSGDQSLKAGALQGGKNKLSGNRNEMYIGGDIIQCQSQQYLAVAANAGHVGSVEGMYHLRRHLGFLYRNRSCLRRDKM